MPANGALTAFCSTVRLQHMDPQVHKYMFNLPHYQPYIKSRPLELITMSWAWGRFAGLGGFQGAGNVKKKTINYFRSKLAEFVFKCILHEKRNVFNVCVCAPVKWITFYLLELAKCTHQTIVRIDIRCQSKTSIYCFKSLVGPINIPYICTT